MDTSLNFAIIVAIIAIIPGIWALINQAYKDKKSQLENASLINHDMYRIVERLQTRINETELYLKHDNFFDELWKNMCEKPVIIRCKYCKSPNTITNITCTQCGAVIDGND